MNPKFHSSLFTRPGNGGPYTHRKQFHRPPTLFYSLAALACGLFLIATSTRAQYVTPSSYMNDLYIWWKQASADHLDYQSITVRATFLGGAAHPTRPFWDSGTPSIAIFEGRLSKNSMWPTGVVTLGPFGPVAKGAGTFYEAADLDALSRNSGIPFMLYSVGNQLVLWMDIFKCLAQR